jgi:hypothetical protein
MRIHPLGDLCLIRRFLDNVLDAPRRVACSAIRLEKIPHGALPYVRAQLLCQLRQDRDIAALPAFGFGNQEHLLFKEDVLNFAVHKLCDPCTGLQQGLDSQSPLPFHPVGVGNESCFLLARESGNHTLTPLRSFNRECTPHLFRPIAPLVIREVVLTPQLLCSVDDAPEPLR